jgi:TatD DNase family protein
MKIITDIHTHDLHRDNAVINLAQGMILESGRVYSVGIHPWDSMTRDVSEIVPLLECPQVVAIGEAGIDKLRGAPLERQIELFKQQSELSEAHRLPMLLHVVKAYPEIIALKRELKPTMPWIIHGFRGKPQLASELLSHGFYLSVGEKYNRDAVTVIPSDRLLVESDESALHASTIAESLPQYDPLLASRLLNLD